MRHALTGLVVMMLGLGSLACHERAATSHPEDLVYEYTEDGTYRMPENNRTERISMYREIRTAIREHRYIDVDLVWVPPV